MSRAIGLDVKYGKLLNKEELLRRLENARKNAYAHDLVTRDIDRQFIALCEIIYKQVADWEDAKLKFMQLLELHKNDMKETKKLCQQQLIEATQEKENAKEAVKNSKYFKDLGEFAEVHAKIRKEAADEFIELLYKKLDIQANMPV
jgi:hypothetical protein